VIDEEALVKALDSGKVASAGLDVYENEPNVHAGLISNPHVLLLPHMGTWTVEVSRDPFFALGLNESFVAQKCGGSLQYHLSRMPCLSYLLTSCVFSFIQNDDW